MLQSIPKHAWKRQFDAKEPDGNIHSPAIPPWYDIIRLLPVAYRVGNHILHEKRNKREPIFDLNGITLQPPHPGPHAGAPIGGLGCGSIGRGFKGEFRRWSLYPGKYIHKAIVSDVFAIRVNRKGKIESVVLSVIPPDENSCLVNWNWRLPASCGTYHAVFPRAWTVYEDPLPNIRVIIKKISPFIPGNYSDSSLPAAVFEVEVENKSTTEEIDVSVLFCFQNGLDSDCLQERQLKGFYHHSFATENSSRSVEVEELKGHIPSVRGVSMHHGSVRTYLTRPSSSQRTASETETDVIYSSNESAEEDENEVERTFADKVSIAIAGRKESNNVVSTCKQFTTRPEINHHLNLFDCSGQGLEDYSKESRTAEELWLEFHNSGDISDRIYVFPEEADNNHTNNHNSNSNRSSIAGGNPLFPPSRPQSERRYGSAVCIRQTIPRASIAKTTPATTTASTSTIKKEESRPLHCGVFTFSLAWDYPLARFGGGKALPRFYTRFFGNDGSNAEKIATYALWKASSWEGQIIAWQEQLWESLVACQPLQEGIDLSQQLPISCEYYKSQIFNELYYLVDGGTQWLDSSRGRSNQSSVPNHETTASEINITQEGSGGSSTQTTKDSLEEAASALQEKLLVSVSSPTSSQHVVKETIPNPKKLSVNTRILLVTLQAIDQHLQQHQLQAVDCTGNQSTIGQFLYLEGHEYLMYNTYDVHFYGGFALLMLWPQLELSLQLDVALAVCQEDLTERQMMGEGDYCLRKKKGVVPHDVGSPSEDPWHFCNAYNFQDVSRWKDLGSKFILQIYRNLYYLSQIAPLTSNSQVTTSSDSSSISLTPQLLSYLQPLFPMLLQVMQGMESHFDLDKDGMIENSGFPDQTYDIWIAKGVHAYCGGLWITACEAMASICSLLETHCDSNNSSDSQRLKDFSQYYTQLASKARVVYLQTLWNGLYLNYDSSTSGHHDSIMADMLAGQWYARVCGLPPPLSAGHAFSCLKTIYDHNVIAFGKGQLLGAVNGMRPEKVDIDQSCIQSREVWTGTTYGLAAVMLQEAFHQVSTTTSQTTVAEGAIGSEILSVEQRKELVQMAYTTAQGIHDAGWQRYGYWFATPEAWEVTGQYRSLGYMRALCIWAMEYARVQARVKKQATATEKIADPQKE